MVLIQMAVLHRLTLVVQDVDQNLNQQLVEEVAVQRQAQTVAVPQVLLVVQEVEAENMELEDLETHLP